MSACARNENVKGAYPPQMPKAVAGAGIGAVTGAAVGGLTSGSSTAPLAGAAIGAMLGAPIGSYYDGEGLILDLQKQGVTVIRLGDILELVIPSDLLFEGADAEIKRTAHPMLQNVMALLQQYGAVNMDVEAYSDSVGTTFDKLRLTELQAQSVTTYLWTHGVNLQRMSYFGMGDTITVAEKHTTIGSAYNRRVTISLWRDDAPSPVKTYAKLQRENCWTRDNPDAC